MWAERDRTQQARSRAWAAAATIAALLALPPSAHADPPVGGGPMTIRASVDLGGRDPNGPSYDPFITGDGRWVVFTSRASDLVTGDNNGTLDVFVRDILAGTTVRASVDTAGGDPNGPSSFANITADGRFVAFRSLASDIVPSDRNGALDVFVRDLADGTTVRASEDMEGGDANGPSQDPDLTPDGRWVAFWSSASDLVPGDGNGAFDVFVRDLESGTTTRVSVDQQGGDPNGESRLPSISEDGRYVLFQSSASDLVPGDLNDRADVFLRDLVAGTTTMVSVDAGGGSAGGSSIDPNLSADGSWAAFYSNAPDIVPGDDNGLYDVFVRDLDAGVTVRASVDTVGDDPNGHSFAPDITPDGRFVAFDSFATDLVTGDGNGRIDAFVFDLVQGTTARVSVDLAGGDANGHTDDPAISADGRFVAVGSFASDLVTGDRNGTLDVFVRRMF